MHFGTFPALTGSPNDLTKMSDDLGIEVWELKPGQSKELRVLETVSVK